MSLARAAVSADAAAEPLVSAAGLTKHFPIREGLFGRSDRAVRAVEDVSFDIGPGEVLGVVGESGSGKSTLGRLVLRLIDPTAGRIRFMGRDLAAMRGAELRRFRRHMQMIF